MIKTSRKWSKYPLKDDPSDLSIALSNNKSTMNLTKETMFENKNISAFGKKTNRLFKGFISSAEIEQHDPDGYKRFMKSKFPYQVSSSSFFSSYNIFLIMKLIGIREIKREQSET